MKNQALFSLKDRSKKLKCRLLQFLFGALRVKFYIVSSAFFSRFMICCDKCEEWFHGKCVGISRARGEEMEKNDEEYICPQCSGSYTH